MGDRANVVIDEQHSNNQIYLYSHWGGSELPATLQAALRKRWRWTDESYLARIIFREIIRGSEDEETGFGISTYEGDNEYPFLRVSTKTQSVTVDYDPVRKYQDLPNRLISFEDYIRIEEITWDVLAGTKEDDR